MSQVGKSYFITFAHSEIYLNRYIPQSIISYGNDRVTKYYFSLVYTVRSVFLVTLSAWDRNVVTYYTQHIDNWEENSESGKTIDLR